MLRCIYCGLCEEACPEEAIFMSKTYVVTGLSRESMVFDKPRLYEIGGTRHDGIRKCRRRWGALRCRDSPPWPARGSPQDASWPGPRSPSCS
jgi:formate hydrogenlyase subunit 6/NADH:ubiquinone oxidoreductase subunit I